MMIVGAALGANGFHLPAADQTIAVSLVVFGLLVLMGLLMASVSYALALKLRDEDSFAPLLMTVTLPLLLLSGVLLPLTLLPHAGARGRGGRSAVQLGHDEA